MRVSIHHIRPGDAFSIHRIGPDSDQGFPEHGHDGFHELFTVLGGRVEHRLAGSSAVLPSGTVVLVRAGDVHGFAFHRASYINLSFPLAEWQRLADYVGPAVPLADLVAAPSPPTARLPAAVHRRLVADLDGLFYRQHAADSRAALATVLLRWLPALPSVPRQAGAPEWLGPLQQAVEERLEQGLTPGDLPGLAGVSREHLARTFRKHLGCTPTAWLGERRLRRAELLLGRTDRGLADIAFALGFGSLSWFHRVFAARHGCSPGVWRQRLGQ